MPRRRIFWIAGLALAGVIAVVLITLALTPAQTHPAFAAAAQFANAAGKGDDATAFALLNDQMQAYVQANCPDGSVSACVESFTPPEWGELVSAVFRRSAPDGDAWDVDLIATYERDTGASGVCIYHRMEQDAGGNWRVAGWAGYIWCGDARSRMMATNPDTPNRAP